jgi:hypothetical protein
MEIPEQLISAVKVAQHVMVLTWDTRVSYDLRGPAGVVLPDLVRRV